jgi:outer membrane protein assembly factor BamB
MRMSRLTTRLVKVLAVPVLALGLFAAPAGAATVSITVSPGAGPPTTTVSVTGSGFGASETVAVDFGATQVATATTSSTGTFSTTFTVPKSALPGSHPVTATGQTSGRSATHSFLVQTDWAKYGFDLDNSGYNPYENVIGPANVSGLKKAWTAATDNTIWFSPSVAGGVVYVNTEDKLYAFSAAGTTGCSGTAKTCKPLWTAAITGDVQSAAPTVANGVVYVAANYTNKNKLYAFSAAGTTNCSGTPKTCKPLWTAATNGYPDSAPAVAGGLVYIGSSNGKLYAFSAAGTTGCSGTPKACKPVWAGATGEYVSSSPAVVNGVVYVVADKLFAFSAAGTTNCSGTPTVCKPLWTGATPGDVGDGSPTVANGVVYTSGEGLGKLAAFSAAGTTGCSGTPKVCQPLWTSTFPGSTVAGTSPSAANGVVYVGGNDGKLYAFSAAGTTGCSGTPKACTPLWVGAGSWGIDSTAAVANGLVYVGAANSRLYAFSATGSTGCSGTPKVCKPVWTAITFDIGYNVSAPVVVNGMVYVGSADTKLYAYSLGSG